MKASARPYREFLRQSLLAARERSANADAALAELDAALASTDDPVHPRKVTLRTQRRQRRRALRTVISDLEGGSLTLPTRVLHRQRQQEQAAAIRAEQFPAARAYFESLGGDRPERSAASSPPAPSGRPAPLVVAFDSASADRVYAARRVDIAARAAMMGHA